MALVRRALAHVSAVLLLVPTLLLPASGSPPARIKVVVLEGMQRFPLQAMLAAGIAERHQIQLDMVRMGRPDGVYTVMQTGDFNVGFAAWLNVALLRSRGARITTVYSTSGYSNEVMVPADSPIRNIGDLRGKRVGVFGGPAAATTWLFRASALRLFGFDPVKDAQVHYSASPILQALLERRELDAILGLDPQISLMLESGRFRSVGNIGSMWRSATGQDPLLLAVTVNEPWARENPEVVRRFVAAYRESLEALRARADLWPRLRQRGRDQDGAWDRPALPTLRGRVRQPVGSAAPRGAARLCRDDPPDLRRCRRSASGDSSWNLRPVVPPLIIPASSPDHWPPGPLRV